MGARRDNITGIERAQIAIETLASYRPYGKVTQLAKKHKVTRQTIYMMAASGKALLDQGMEPGPHGAKVNRKMVCVNDEHVERSAVVLKRFGVSQRDIPVCLEEVLDTRLSSSWVNGQLAKRETKAAEINQGWQPSLEETFLGTRFTRTAAPICWWWAMKACIFMR